MIVLKTVILITSGGTRYKLKKNGVVPIELTDVEVKALQKAGYISVPKTPKPLKTLKPAAKKQKQKNPKKELIFDTVTTKQHKIEEESDTKFNFNLFGKEDK